MYLFAVASAHASAECPDGWTIFGHSCYFFGHSSYSFNDSQSFCVHLGASLVNVESDAENTFIPNRHWIGLTDEVNEGVWTLYPSEEATPFLDWSNHTTYPQPNDGTYANCAAYFNDHNYHWVDEPCQKSFNPICEMSVNGNPVIVG